jgi:diphosphomevalonate decarboxylase
MISTASAAAHPNIAFIKYWGNRDHELRIPANGSLSMNLAPLETRTTVSFDTDLKSDQLTLNGKEAGDQALERVSTLLDRIRNLAKVDTYARVVLAATTSLGLELPEKALSQIARTGSGSASRSIPGGFVEWEPEGESSYAYSIADPGHWDLVDFITLISQEHKKVVSSEGHKLAGSSPLQKARVKDTPRRLNICRQALHNKDFMVFAEIVEQDSNLMHSVMMTSDPPLYYWQPGTIEVMHAVQQWRQEGLPVCFTIDAGPNVHVICPAEAADKVRRKLGSLIDVKSILECTPGGPAWLLEPEIPGV